MGHALTCPHTRQPPPLGEQRFRLWRIYLGATSYYFQKGHLSIFQSLLAKPDEDRQASVPLSRGDLYS